MTQNLILSEIILCVQGGIYVFQLMDHYTAVVSLMFLAFFEVLAITLIFGEFHFLQSALQDHRKPYAAIEAPLQLRYEGFLLSRRSEPAQSNGGENAGKETKPLLPCLLAVPVTHACAGEEKKTRNLGSSISPNIDRSVFRKK